jgi:hypothetical protein
LRTLGFMSLPGHYPNKLAYLILSRRYFNRSVKADHTE